MSCKNEEEHEEGGLASLLARRAHRIDRSGQGWMVCSPDARSLRPPALLPASRRACGAATPVVLQVQGMMTRAIGDQPGTPVMSPAMATALHAHPSSLDLSGDTHTRPSGRG